MQPETLAQCIFDELTRQAADPHSGPYVRRNGDDTVTVDGSIDIIALAQRLVNDFA